MKIVIDLGEYEYILDLPEAPLVGDRVWIETDHYEVIGREWNCNNSALHLEVSTLKVGRYTRNKPRLP